MEGGERVGSDVSDGVDVGEGAQALERVWTMLNGGVGGRKERKREREGRRRDGQRESQEAGTITRVALE